jgi:hypothetical protein
MTHVDRSLRLGLVAIVAAASLAACGSSGPSTEPSGPGSPTPLPSPRPVPSLEVPESWPSSVVTAVIALAAADAEFASAGGDLIAAANTSDLELMLRAANGLASLVGVNRSNAQALADYEPFAELGQAYLRAFDLLESGASALSQAITAGDAEGIVEASRTIAAGVSAYGEVREPISVLLPEALRQSGAKVK